MPDYDLTELQLEIMNILWSRGEATVVEVREGLRPERELAHSTVATLLSRLEKKGVIDHRTEGREYVYSSTVDASKIRRSVVSDFTDLADRLFGGDLPDLVNHLLDESEVDPDELAEVRTLIEEKEAELRRTEKEEER